MTWLRTSDTANDSDVVTAPLAWEPDNTWPVLDAATDMGLLSLALRGLVDACATTAAGGGKYVVTNGAIARNAFTPHWRLLAQLAERAGYWTALPDGSGYELIDDPKELYNIIREEAREWETIRRADVSNRDLTVPVRHRDGDGCRYCGHVVIWGDRKGARGGTYDHRIPGQGAKSPDDMVVACRSCNSARKDDPDKIPLLDVPTKPYYSAGTAAYLAKAGVIVQQTETARPGGQPDAAPSKTARPATAADTAPGTVARPAPADTAHRDPAPGGTPRTEPTARPAPSGPRAPRPGDPPEPATRSIPVDQAEPRSADPADHVAEGSGFAGSGPGRVGSGAPDHPPGDPSAQNQARSLPRSRRRRARRSKPTKGATP
jgi:hypothetical protein